MDFWIERGTLMTWIDSRRIQSRVIARDVIDGDLNERTGQWLVTRRTGQVEALDGKLCIPVRRFSTDGVRARWNGDMVQVQESDNRTRLYDSRGFLQRVL